MTINLSKHAGGGNQKYLPGMMTFDGSSGYYSSAITTSGNKVTALMRFNRASFSGGGQEYLLRHTDSGINVRMNLQLWANDHAVVGRRDKVTCWISNSAGTNICFLHSINSVMDGEDHILLCAFDGDNGLATFTIDSINAIDISNAEYLAPTTGTLGSGAGSVCNIGASFDGSSKFAGELGYCGIHQVYLTNPTDFYHSTNGLQEIDETGWTEWGSQPLFWNQHGLMTDNKGSAGNMTATGTITGPD